MKEKKNRISFIKYKLFSETYFLIKFVTFTKNYYHSIIKQFWNNKAILISYLKSTEGFSMVSLRLNFNLGIGHNLKVKGIIITHIEVWKLWWTYKKIVKSFIFILMFRVKKISINLNLFLDVFKNQRDKSESP